MNQLYPIPELNIIVTGARPPQGNFYTTYGFEVVDVTIPAAGIVDLAYTVPTDYDFIWLSLHGSKSAAYNLRIKYPDSRWMMTAPTADVNFVSPYAGSPTPLLVPFYVRGGERFSFDFTTAVPNTTVQLVLGGIRRYIAG